MSNVVQLFPAARSARVTSAADGVKTMAKVLRARIEERRALRALLRQPDSVLADAGWTRAAAQREAVRGFWRR